MRRQNQANRQANARQEERRNVVVADVEIDGKPGDSSLTVLGFPSTLCKFRDFYEFLNVNVVKKLPLYIDLAGDDAVAKIMIYAKSAFVKEYGADYYSKHEVVIKKIVSILFEDFKLTTITQRGIDEELVQYDCYWDKLRQPNENSPIISDEIPNMLVKLRMYQQAVLYSMFTIEKNRCIIHADGRKLIVNAADLSMQLGSGKTIVVLAMICHDKNIREAAGASGAAGANSLEWYHTESSSVLFTAKNMLQCNLIFVNPNSFDQWRAEILEKTRGLRVAYISDAKSMQAFISNIAAVSALDIILIKNGTATLNIGTILSGKNHLMNAMGKIFADYTFNRIIIDDFDITRMSPNDGDIRARFYWYVSATVMKHRASTENEFSLKIYPRSATKWIFENLAICPTDHYIKLCNELPKLTTYVTVVQGENREFIDKIKDAAQTDAVLADIMEMIDADAIDELAKKLEIAIETPADLFRRLMHRSYEPYMKAVQMLRDTAELALTPYNPNAELHADVIRQINDEIRGGGLVTKPPFIDKAVFNLIKNINESANNIKAKEGALVDRLRRSASECKVCNLPLYDANETMDESIGGVIILPCCCSMFCNKCAIMGSGFHVVMKLRPHDWRNIANEFGDEVARQVAHAMNEADGIDDADVDDEPPPPRQIQPRPHRLNQPIPNQPNQPNQPIPNQPNQPMPNQPNQQIQPNQANQPIQPNQPNQPMPNQHNQPNQPKRNETIIQGNCPACRAVINKTDMIFLSVKTDIGQKIQDDAFIADSSAGQIIGKELTDEEKAKLEFEHRFDHFERYKAKFCALMEIIEGKKPAGATAIDKKYINVMCGSLDVPDNDRRPEDVKLLVFCKFQSTLDRLQDFFAENKIKYVKLAGSSVDKRNQINWFKNTNDLHVMILMTSNDCVGLNIQFVTDCVFLHSMASLEIESQSIGRCQRIGRPADLPLRVHHL